MLQINALVTNFDAELRFLRHKKLQLDVQMKYADLSYITWFEELLILKNAEKNENILQGHVNTLRSEQEAMQVCRLCIFAINSTDNEWPKPKGRCKINRNFSLLPFCTDPASSAKFWKTRNSQSSTMMVVLNFESLIFSQTS